MEEIVLGGESKERLDTLTVKLGMGVSLLSVVSLAFYAGALTNRIHTLEETLKLLTLNQQTLVQVSNDLSYLRRDINRLESDLKELQQKVKVR